MVMATLPNTNKFKVLVMEDHCTCSIRVINYLPINYCCYLDCSVQRSTGECIVVFGVDDDLHHVVGVALKHLGTRPFLLPVPQLNQHVIYNTSITRYTNSARYTETVIPRSVCTNDTQTL